MVSSPPVTVWENAKLQLNITKGAASLQETQGLETPMGSIGVGMATGETPRKERRKPVLDLVAFQCTEPIISLLVPSHRKNNRKRDGGYCRDKALRALE